MSFSFLSSVFGIGSSTSSSPDTGATSTTPSTTTSTSTTGSSLSTSTLSTSTTSSQASIPAQNSINGMTSFKRTRNITQQQQQPSTLTPPSTTAAQVGTAGVWIFLVLDESGSMTSSQQATITAFNDYIKQQREAKMEGNVMVSLMKFEGSNIKMVYDRMELKEVPALTTRTYVPAGSTNLHDAMGDAMSRIDNKLNESHSLLERSAVLFVVLTDGEENASQHYTGARIKDMITARRAVGWQFIFLGANIEAADVAERMGISRSAAFQCDTHASSGYSNAMQDITMKYRSKCHQVQQVATSHLNTKSSLGYEQATSLLNSNLANEDFDQGTRDRHEAHAPSKQRQQLSYPTMKSMPNIQQQQQQQQQQPPQYNQLPTSLFPQQNPPPYNQNQMPPPYQSPQQVQQPLQSN